MDIQTLISAADFSEEDIDIGTSGLCGMFALALYRVILPQRPALVLIGAAKDGKVLQSRDGGIYWSHAAVSLQGNYFDIEGKQKLEWMFSNYAWKLPVGAHPTVIEQEHNQFIHTMRMTKSACDFRYYIRWRSMLDSTMSQIK